jgi:DNA-binding NtrC family response regulator
LSPKPSIIIASSPAMKAVLEAVRAAASSHGGVLVCGESGSGRRMIARDVHHHAAGNGAPFVSVDCAGVDELESALFGLPPVAGNGDAARARLDRVSKDSLLYQAVGGTLFLAHLREMPARVQARLARVLRDGEVRVAEPRRTIRTHLRLIASADRDWDAAVAEGQIRSDLVRRCSTLRINMPPLRDRREDIPALAAMFLEDLGTERGVERRTLDASAMALLCAFPWRGNARELRALMGALVQRPGGPTMRLDDVLAVVHLDGSARSFLGEGTLREAKERFEHDYIAAVLERHRGRVAEAAAALGIQRPNLYRKMRTLRLHPGRAGLAAG